jgi:tetratricopeptide (TPR) repeat protein
MAKEMKRGPGKSYDNKTSRPGIKNKIAYTILPLFIIALTGLLVYSNTLESPFFFDDEAHIEKNPYIRMTRLNFDSLYDAAFKSPLPQRPIANISFALNYYFHGYNRAGYHITNIAIHILAAFFLYLLLKETLSLPLFQNKYQHYKYLAFAAALIWLLHPMHTQAVTYIVQRMTSLAALFYILSLFLYVKGRTAYRNHRRSWPWFIGCAVSGILSFGCKEITATLPFFILLYEWFFFQDLRFDWLKKNILFIIAAFVILLILSALYLGAEPAEKMAGEHERWGFTTGQRVITQGRVILFYISLILYPHPNRLNLDHDFTVSTGLLNPPQTLLSIMIILCLILFAILRARKNRLISFCILWFFGNLAIESSVIGIELVYEHRLYLPSMFAIFTIALLLWHLAKLPLLKAIVFIVAVFGLSFAAYQRNKVWQNELSLWSDCAAKSPNKPRSNYNLAYALYMNKDYEQAAKYYNNTIRLDPNRFDAYEGLGFVYLSEGNTEQAINYGNKALELNPRAKRANYVIGQAYYRQGLMDKAISYYLQGLQNDPALFEIYNNLGMAYYKSGKTDEAVQNWNKGLQFNPDRLEILNNLAWLKATAPDDKYRNASESINLAEKANRIADYKEPDFLDTLAAAYAESGQFQNAAVTAQKAMKIAHEKGNTKLAEEINKRLKLYQTQKPYREQQQKKEIGTK